jgi:small GTP-binding protein
MTDLPAPVGRRRTFAIISHPDAGKTTLTEKLLLFGGAIQLAGEVKAKKNRVSTRSDWMGIEKERGISVVTSVMTFEYGDCVFNLLDTPGHEDFSEDTYRTLTAVDSAIMVIDAAKGIEARTRKLFEVCRMRDIPIVTFINKMDREARNPFDLLDEIEKTLALDTAPVTWPISQGKSFAGTFDLRRNLVRRIDTDEEPTEVSGPDDPKLLSLLPPEEADAWQEEVSLAQEACKPFDLDAFREGHLTPVFFGSALRNFGVRDLIDALAAYAPPPRGQEADKRLVEAGENRMTGFVFKIQANMDPNHRDRIAFMRICSGKLQRGMKAKLVRTGKPMSLNTPQFFFAQDRAIADEAWAQPRNAAHRRYPDRGRGHRLPRGPELRAGNLAPHQAAGRHEGQEAARGLAADGRRGRRPALRAAGRLGRHRGRGRRAPARRAQGATCRRIRPAHRLRADAFLDLPLDHGGRSARARQVHRKPPVVHGTGPRSGARVHGGQHLQSAIRDGSLQSDPVLGCEGLSEEGGLRPGPSCHSRPERSEGEGNP